MNKRERGRRREYFDCKDLPRTGVGVPLVSVEEVEVIHASKVLKEVSSILHHMPKFYIRVLKIRR